MPFNGEGAKRCVLIDDLSQCDVLWIAPPGVNLVHIVPSHHDDALRRIALNRSHRPCTCCTGSSYREKATIRRFDDRLSLWCKLVRASVRARRFGFHDIVDRRFGLSVEALN